MKCTNKQQKTNKQTNPYSLIKLFSLLTLLIFTACGGGGGGGGGTEPVTSSGTSTQTPTPTPTPTLTAPTIQVPTGKALLSGSKVGISTSVAGATIYYTLDGTEPTSSSSVYTTNKVTINSACTLKAVAINNGVSSDVVSATYSIATIKNAPDAVNDIVFKDGKAVAYSTDLYFTDEFKANAIAMIFFRELTAYTTRTFGVGLKCSDSPMKWCLGTANAYNTNIYTIQCPASGSAGTYTFSGDKDGSDNLSQIATLLAGSNDTGIAGNYPAFEYAKNYGSTNGCTGAYANGWYLPSIAELYQIYNLRTNINAAVALCGSAYTFSLMSSFSSTQYASIEHCSYTFDFGSGDCDHAINNSPYCVCAIRAF